MFQVTTLKHYEVPIHFPYTFSGPVSRSLSILLANHQFTSIHCWTMLIIRYVTRCRQRHREY